VHRRLCGGGVPLSIFRDGFEDATMQPSATLIPGTLGSFKNAALDTSFYWMPLAINLPGVDGVLNDGNGNIYALQATIADDHTSPVQGLRSIWKKAAQLRNGTWHFVVVTNSTATAYNLVKDFSNELKTVTFGNQNVCMEVRGCVLK
jgi:hypothetical protein